jgi:long-chain fatty acid transport protein
MNHSWKRPLAVHSIALAAAGLAQATNVGTDTNLSYKPAAGAMGGAAYTVPQEASAAVFGNPATLTQFKGTSFNFGAAYLGANVENTQTSAAGTNTSKSRAKDYLVPDVGIAIDLGSGLAFGLGLEVDAGVGADYRNAPISLVGVAGAATLPLVVELISFNANFALAKKVAPDLSVGAALTLGFGLAQLGTVGPTAGLPAALGNFGGTTGDVHAFGSGMSFGATYELNRDMTLSGAYKSKVKYTFKDVIYADTATTGGGAGYQSLAVEQPAEVVLGMAWGKGSSPWLMEADLVWKNWSNAATYKDAWKDQWLLALGAQHSTGAWKLRAGYHYSSDIMRKDPNNTLGGLVGLGSVPLGSAANTAGLGEVARDVVKIVQTSLLPVVTKHTLSAGFGYELNRSTRIDVFAAYALKESVERSDPNAAAALGAPATTFKGEVQIWTVGAGLVFSF